MQKKIVVLTGAGMSAESGISTFRDSNGLWENHDIMDVASPIGWKKNPKLVLDFYNARRAQLKEVQPNRGHEILAELEQSFNVQIITQNVDNLHERAGSSNILHLHGELVKVRGEFSDEESIYWENDINLGDVNENAEQLRPDIVWFGEQVPAIDFAIPHMQSADIVIIIGTSLQVYPAAGLMHYAKSHVPVYYIDPNPATIYDLKNPLEVLPMSASEGMEILKEKL
ncbi:SIR2 family NAD-dependent protein deacylase [Flavobacterium difficile]|uniref:NAD-dependent protein deacylase n=1 Tax=Flavobacterium difficile TaxID=2709659 RepID=A0ABX0IAW8_9FLAO|nr:NAD-dependent deacylase [Flavobacterium difficile]NHM02999.1 NAD-dependent deacylase [Flavobacterium difficile]